jgi:hypothetical protein
MISSRVDRDQLRVQGRGEVGVALGEGRPRRRAGGEALRGGLAGAAPLRPLAQPAGPDREAHEQPAGPAVDHQVVAVVRGRALCCGDPVHRPQFVLDLPGAFERQLARRLVPLARHFKSATGTTPLQWLSTQRIRRAQELLENTDNSIDAVAQSAGMGTATTLRRHFNHTVGVSPDAYRRTFRSGCANSNGTA